MEEYVIGAIIGIAIGGIAGFLFLKKQTATKLQVELVNEREKIAAERETAREKGEADGRRLLEQERDSLAKTRAKEKELAEQHEAQLSKLEQKLEKRENGIEKREHTLEQKLAAVDNRDAKMIKREQRLELAEKELAEREQTITEREDEIGERLSKVAGLSKEEASEQLFKRLDQELIEEQGKLIAKREKEAEENAKEVARNHVSRAIQRYAAEHTAETTIAKITLEDDEMKGRIIGKEGRNIRAFEQQTGVDLIVDDTPHVITVSCFDGVRREIARRSLLKLIEDGRIHPARIEEVQRQVTQDLDREVMKMGEEAAFACDVSGIHPRIIKLLGKLHYRTSYGQNVLKHSQEVAFLTGALTADLGLDPKMGRRCGLLHDIGKALDHEQEGSHPELGFEVLKRYNEHKYVANAALAHHEGHEVISNYTTLTAAADAISAARPGARRENVERYIKRLEQLEDIACGYRGVMKAYAIQAGRELRIFVNGNSIPDKGLPKLSRDIARQIEDEVAYPGEVKVTLIRETRQTSVAR